MDQPQDHAHLPPPPSGHGVLIAGALDGEAMGSALRAWGFDVTWAHLDDLEAQLATGPAVVIVDVDHEGAAAALERLHQPPLVPPPAVLLLGHPARAAAFSSRYGAPRVERPVELTELAAQITAALEPRVVSFPPPPPSYPRLASGRPPQLESDPPLELSDYPPELEPIDVGSLLPPAPGDDGLPRLGSTRISPELEQLLAAAEARVTGSARPSSVPSVDDEADLILSADILGVLEEPLDPEDDGPRTGSASDIATPMHGHASQHGHLDMSGPSSLPLSLSASSGAGAWAAGSPFGGALLHPPPASSPGRKETAEFPSSTRASLAGQTLSDPGPAITPRAGTGLLRHTPYHVASEDPADIPPRSFETTDDEERWAAGTRAELDARRAQIEIEEDERAQAADGWEPSLTSTSTEQPDIASPRWTSPQREVSFGTAAPAQPPDTAAGSVISGYRAEPGSSATFTGPRTEAGRSSTFSGPHTEAGGVPTFPGSSHRAASIAPLVSPPREVQVRSLSEASPRFPEPDASPLSAESHARAATISDFPIDDGLDATDDRGRFGAHPAAAPPRPAQLAPAPPAAFPSEPPGVVPLPVHAEDFTLPRRIPDPPPTPFAAGPAPWSSPQEPPPPPAPPRMHAPPHPHASSPLHAPPLPLAPSPPLGHAASPQHAPPPRPTGAPMHAGAPTHAGLATHTGAPTHAGLATHAGAPTHAGLATHAGAPTHAGLSTHAGSPLQASPPLHTASPLHPHASPHAAPPLYAHAASQEPPSPTPPGLSLEGTSTGYTPPAVTVLGPGDAPRALARAVGSRASGSMALTTEAGTRRVVLHEGDIVTAASEVPDETLLAFLATRGDLDRDLVARLSNRLPASGRHAGAALIAHGYLGQDDLWPVLRAHAEWIIGHLVHIDAGTCEIEEEAPGRLKAEPNVFGGATGAEVFVETIRRVIPADVALRRLGGPAARLDEGARRNLLGECALHTEEEDLFRAARGRSVAELIEATEPEMATLLYALVCLEVLDVLIPPSISEAPRVQEHDPLDEEAIRQRVRARLQVVQDGDYFSLLGIAREATSYEIKRAYLNLRRAFEPSRLLTAGTADLLDDVQLIIEVLDEAYDILREPHRRERYRRAIEAAPP
ncbi:hypothetical protein [Chondromyces crocatus]|uniref:J domain-containing protein n=1 Tax=Chondromyces crocatus TaxID=52 RepID=A0A0K1E739_CHOCO|nr:hypothetical protein [Chondromyces crocatus]AKT36664.1 uncharacterized protein CMC5_007840 [Chondromyces crocatus]